MRAKVVVLMFLVIAQALDVRSQGCSDAGFCSINGVKPEHTAVERDSVVLVNTFKSGVSIGNTRYDVGIVSSTMEYIREMNPKLTVSAKLSGQYRWGALAREAGMSDLMLVVSYHVSKSTGIITGGKFPFNNANRSHDGKALPMAYQTSLGTYDAIVGVQYVAGHWLFASAWQQPLVQNSNTFSPERYLQNELGAAYLGTNQYERAGDVLLRVSYTHSVSSKVDKLSFVYSILPIYHLQNDRFVDAMGVKKQIDRSRGLTVNANVFATYNFSRNSALEFSAGVPLRSRKVRPDGMSQFALTLELIKRF